MGFVLIQVLSSIVVHIIINKEPFSTKSRVLCLGGPASGEIECRIVKI